MTLTAAKRNKISPYGLFFMLYIGRVAVCLTNVQAVTFTRVSGDILISIVISLFLTLVLSLPAIYCCVSNKNPFDVKWIGVLYFLFFVFTAGLNISRFSYFASTTLNPETQSWLFSIFIIIGAFYCAVLGIEALSRFSFFAFILMVAAILTVLFCGLKKYDEINLYPIISNDRGLILMNSLTFTSNTVEGAAIMCLYGRVNGPVKKSFASFVIASYLTIFLLLLVMLGVLGDSASLQSFPLYTLFQMTKISSFERLDIVHISFWVMSVFFKAALMLYCASISIKSFEHKKKCAVSAAAAFAVSLLLGRFISGGSITPYIIAVYLVFCVAIPLLTLIFKKKNSGDILVERF